MRCNHSFWSRDSKDDRLLWENFDVKSAFRQLLVDPAGPPPFGYVGGLRLQSGRRSNPGVVGVGGVYDNRACAPTDDTRGGAAHALLSTIDGAQVKLAPPTGEAMQCQSCRGVEYIRRSEGQ